MKGSWTLGGVEDVCAAFVWRCDAVAVVAQAKGFHLRRHSTSRPRLGHQLFFSRHGLVRLQRKILGNHKAAASQEMIHLFFIDRRLDLRDKRSSICANGTIAFVRPRHESHVFTAAKNGWLANSLVKSNAEWKSAWKEKPTFFRRISSLIRQKQVEALRAYVRLDDQRERCLRLSGGAQNLSSMNTFKVIRESERRKSSPSVVSLGIWKHCSQVPVPSLEGRLCTAYDWLLTASRI